MAESVRSGSPPVLVVGAGVAGMTAALDLARMGVPVHLVEREGHLGGQVMRLDKLYPSDHCAFCPVWTDGAACLAHPLATVHRYTTLVDIEIVEGRTVAELSVQRPAVDPETCVFCGLCREACEARGVPGAIQMRPDRLPRDPAASPAPVLDPAICSRCGECASACPTGAVDPFRLDRPPEYHYLVVSDVIFATGFAERIPETLTEYCPDGHPDLFTSMDFESWTSETGPNAGVMRRRSNGATPRSVGFIQCAGARDQRFHSYCASVCCMHALKQARWTRRRVPDASVAVFFTDLRAVGKGCQEYANAAAREGVLLVRSRPGLIFPLQEETGDSTLALRYEDVSTGRVITAELDIVVLNGGLSSCPLPGPTVLGERAHLSCGFCREPGDVSQSVIQGSSAAALVAARMAGGMGRGL